MSASFCIPDRTDVLRFLALTLLPLLLLGTYLSAGYLPPVENSYVTSTFMEFRATGKYAHLHFGADFSTFLKEGVPIRAAEDGYLVRLEIDQGGLYGNTLVLEHPDGNRTLYAHLQRFSEKMDHLTKLLVEEFGNQRIVVEFSSDDFVFKKGELIAYSGKTGQAPQPHCHFEVRDRAERFLLDPLAFIDRTELKQLRSQILTKNIIVNGREFEYVPGRTYEFKGEYPQISVETYTELAKNLLGVKEIKLYFSNELVYHIILDRLPISLGEKPYLLYDERSKMSGSVYKTFYKLYRSTLDDGETQDLVEIPFVRINKVAEFRDSTYDVLVEVRDDFGNIGRFQFKLKKAG